MIRHIRMRLGHSLRDERGGIAALVAVALIMVLASTGLAVDMGRGYVERLRLGRAVDAGALAGARALRLGQPAAVSEATAVARANGVAPGVGDIATSIQFGVNSRGENTITMQAGRTIPTTFMKVLGRQDMTLGVSATAAVTPLDLVLVLDQSGSLRRTNSWGNLQNAARNFVGYFDDSIDQLGLVSFQLTGVDRFQIGPNFKRAITSEISAMPSAGDTNMGEGLRLALQQMQRGNIRQTSGKVVVFFTDGRPTATRATIGLPGNPQDRIISTNAATSNAVRGYFDNPDAIPPDILVSPDGCPDFLVCFGWDEATVRSQSQQAGLVMADAIRSQGIVIYSIALGDPNQIDPLLTPDLDYLRSIANEGGISSPTQPQGRMFFAPSPAELQGVFDLVARDLLVRLAN
ncbi:MAG: VWA domain-containing protein [Gemmatimonadota bacterium]